jgi:hypothetical protein
VVVKLEDRKVGEEKRGKREEVDLKARRELESEPNSSKSIASNLINVSVLVFHFQVSHDVEVFDNVAGSHDSSGKSRVECLEIEERRNMSE